MTYLYVYLAISIATAVYTAVKLWGYYSDDIFDNIIGTILMGLIWPIVIPYGIFGAASDKAKAKEKAEFDRQIKDNEIDKWLKERGK